MTKMGSYRVLIVDDEEQVRNFIVSLLSKYGHSCETAKDGAEALEIIKKSSFDSAVIDIVIPGMDGVTLTRELVNLYPRLPIMIMTGHSDEHSVGSAMAAGAREFIEKPFSIDEFTLRFNKMMRDQKGEEELLTLSLTDELTGLYNRRRFFILTDQCLKVAIRKKKRWMLLYIDMDDLKWINDHCGHNEGDQALIGLGTILKKTFRESDVIARIGGDEFAVLLESTDESDAMLMTRLYENIKDFNAKVSQDYKLSISLGAARFDPDYPVSIDKLLSKADALMYAQKRRAKEILQRNRKMRVKTNEKELETIKQNIRSEQHRTPFLLAEARNLACRIVKLRDEDGSESNDWTASVEVVMGALYSLPDAPIPDEIDEEAFLAFARVNGLYNCWPYLRVEVNRIAGSMNLALVLPTLRILPAATTEGGATKRATAKAQAARSKRQRGVRVQRKSDQK